MKLKVSRMIVKMRKMISKGENVTSKKRIKIIWKIIKSKQFNKNKTHRNPKGNILKISKKGKNWNNLKSKIRKRNFQKPISMIKN
jgi:hypothetical protein